MRNYLNININELDDTKKRYKEIYDELETIEKIVSELVNQFARENSSETANKIVEIMENYENIITTNIDMFEAMHDSVDEYLELIDEMLEPSSYANIVIDFEELVSMRTELNQVLDDPIQEVLTNISSAETVIVEEIEYLKRQIDNLETDEKNLKKHYLEQINDLKYNKDLLKDLLQSLKSQLKFEDELEDIDQQIENLEEFITEEAGLDVTHIEDTLNELEAFKLEVNIHALNALLPKEITNKLIDQVLDKLGIETKDKQQLIDKIAELKQTGMFDNFYANVRTQIELMGLEQFLSDPNRIKWLADNPQIRVGEFSSDLSPNQLRMLCEELPYVLFSKNPDGGLEFRGDFYEYLTWLTSGEYIIMDTMFGSKQIYTDRFLDNGLVFEQVNKPGTKEPWYVDENGFQAVVMRVNGEIIIMYPGSQEMYADWLMTDTVPNLFHSVPKQYQAASEFAAEVQAEYPDEEIILTGQSLAGGSVEYAGNINDMMSFGIDPAPGKVANPGGDKGITIIPNGVNDGLLNNITSNQTGYNQSNTHVDLLNVISIAGGPVLIIASLWGQANDNSSSHESAYLNLVSETDDSDSNDKYHFGPNDNMNGYFGNHFSGDIDDQFEYAYVPKGKN